MSAPPTTIDPAFGDEPPPVLAFAKQGLITQAPIVRVSHAAAPVANETITLYDAPSALPLTGTLVTSVSSPDPPLALGWLVV
ncbi:MAG: hypothetical protein ACRELY_15515 [Polyangiaceae bacterium]